MTIIYLIRHAEVENPEGIEYMRLPGFGISAFGEKQATKVGKKLRELGLDRIYASPLERTKETARIISDGTIPIRYLEDIIEVNYHKWQGIKKDDRDPGQVEGYAKDPVKYSAILGESLTEVQHRMKRALFGIIEKHPGERIGVVTHAAPVIVSRLLFEGKSLMEFNKCWVDFASVTTITLDSELRCEKVEYHEYVDQREEYTRI